MHLALRPSFRNGHQLPAGSIREVVFGVEDGVVQNMTLIAGMVGAALSSRVIVIAAVINAMAGVFSMSMGTYLSSKAERDVAIAVETATTPPATDTISSPPNRVPQRDALVMASAYALGAVIPVLPFVGGLFGQSVALGVAVVLTGVTLFLLGVGKAALSNQPRIAAGLEMLLLASAAGLAGYLVGIAARAIFGLQV